MGLTQAREGMKLILALAFLGVVCAFLALYFRFSRSIAPQAVDRWAKDRGYKVIHKRTSTDLKTAFSRFGMGISSTQELVHVTIRDGDGRQRSCWLIIGSRVLPCQTVAGCPVEVRWDDRVPDDCPIDPPC